ncbi:GNAT family N-acetyltransferase [Pontibacter liquoris]|uniref:GNAT family N-acetyltransferase n=1 Tax=Pontibacter liquoris TaxID=2905677 RepID=UPI001FA6D6DF|nr:GNAT family N-acetyltransferase [Pontibacter liquoris]
MIQIAEPDDIDDVFELWRELLDYHQPLHRVFAYYPEQEQALKAELLYRMKDKDTRIFGFVQDDEWQGLLIASMRKATPGLKLAHKGYVAETVVKEKYRGSGVGKVLFEAAKKWLIDHGADHLELQVAINNPTGVRFWEAQGFKVSTQHMVLELAPRKK